MKDYMKRLCHQTTSPENGAFLAFRDGIRAKLVEADIVDESVF